MNRSAFIFLAFLFVLCLNGCKLEFTALTKINEDGSGFRITSYAVNSEDEKKELYSKYSLPEGGTWTHREYAQRSQYGPSGEDIYEVKRSFKKLSELSPDCVRRGADPNNVSSNTFSLNIRRHLLFTTYEYEEVFKDCTDQNKIRRFAEKYYDKVLTVTSDSITAEFPNLVERNKLRGFLDATYRSEFDYFLSIFVIRGYKPFMDEDNKELQDRMRRFEECLSGAGFSALITDYIMRENKGLDRDSIVKRVKESYASIEKEIQTYQSELADKNWDDALGVYGIPIFMSYPFEVSITLPGRIIEANTKEVRMNTAAWNFCQSDFFITGYKLKAVSRKINYSVIIIAALLVLILATIGLSLKRKNK